MTDVPNQPMLVEQARELFFMQGLDPEERIVAKVGKLDAKKNVDSQVHSLMSSNILQCMGTMLDTVVF